MNEAVVLTILAVVAVVLAGVAVYVYRRDKKPLPPAPEPKPKPPPTPVPFPDQMTVVGNNGSCPADNYCARNWSGQLPLTWGGAKAVTDVRPDGTQVCQREDSRGWFMGNNCSGALTNPCMKTWGECSQQ